MSPLPKVPHQNMKKRPYDYSAEENKAIADIEYKKWKAGLGKKKPKETEFPSTPEEHAACVKMVKNLQQPPPILTPDYDRSIIKSAEAQQQRLKSSSAPRSTVPQLGEQKNQSCPPLKVFSHTEVGSSRGAAEQYYDPEIVAAYGEAAAAHGMSIAEYLAHDSLPKAEEKYKYRHGAPLVKPELVKDLPTKMRRVHNWYMRESEVGANWIYCGYKNEHYGHGDGVVMIEFIELFQLYQQDAIDKAIISAYCL
jgi:hypothetical protein